MKILFQILKITLLLVAITAMYFTSHFSIGSQEDWNNAIKSGFWAFYFSRLLFTLIISAFIFLFSVLLNWIFRKTVIYKRKMVLFEIVVILFFAIIMTTIAVMK